MAAHRYWRAVGLETYGAVGLEISEFHLLSIETRVDQAAALTSNIAPLYGSLANLKDGSASTDAAWSAGDVRALVLSWDFGGGGAADVTNIRLGSTAAPVDKFLLVARIQWSDDGVAWTDLRTYAGISHPGARSLTASSSLSGGAGGWNPFDRHQSVSVTGPGNETASDGSSCAVRAVQGQSSGRRLFEVLTTATQTDSYYIGAGTGAASLDAGPGVIGQNAWGLRWNGMRWFNGGEAGGLSSPHAIGDVIGVVVDFSDGTITFYRNGILLGGGPAYTGISGTLFPMVGGGGSGTGWVAVLSVDLPAFPIAGAEPWATLAPQILINPVRGRAVGPVGIVIPTAASVAKPFSIHLPDVARARKDYLLGGYGLGIGRVKGTTKDKGTPNVPVSERVRLHRMRDGVVIGETWSARGTGTYAFNNIDETESYYVVAFDHDGNFRAAIADNLSVANGGVELVP